MSLPMTREVAIKLGAIIRKAREQKEITQLELAKTLGYDSTQFVSLFERGLSRVPFDKLKLICSHLEISETMVKKLIIEDFKTQLEQVFAN